MSVRVSVPARVRTTRVETSVVAVVVAVTERFVVGGQTWGCGQVLMVRLSGMVSVGRICLRVSVQAKKRKNILSNRLVTIL